MAELKWRTEVGDPLIKASPVQEKDCRTCTHYAILQPHQWTEHHAIGDEVVVDYQVACVRQPCILGSSYERAEFTPLWRTE